MFIRLATENCPYYDSRVVNYNRKLLYKIDHWLVLKATVESQILQLTLLHVLLIE